MLVDELHLNNFQNIKKPLIIKKHFDIILAFWMLSPGFVNLLVFILKFF